MILQQWLIRKKLQPTVKIQLEKGQCDWLASIYSRTLQLENLFTRVLKEAIERRTFVDTLYQVMGWVPIALDHFTFFTSSSLKMRSFSPSKPTCRVDIMINPSVEKGFKNKCRFYLFRFRLFITLKPYPLFDTSSVPVFKPLTVTNRRPLNLFSKYTPLSYIV